MFTRDAISFRSKPCYACPIERERERAHLVRQRTKPASCNFWVHCVSGWPTQRLAARFRGPSIRWGRFVTILVLPEQSSFHLQEKTYFARAGGFSVQDQPFQYLFTIEVTIAGDSNVPEVLPSARKPAPMKSENKKKIIKLGTDWV